MHITHTRFKIAFPPRWAGVIRSFQSFEFIRKRTTDWLEAASKKPSNTSNVFPFDQPDGKQNGSPLPAGRQKREFLGEYVRLARVGPKRADFERKLKPNPVKT
ncbi:MAG: hypothetical protein MUC97_18930 [Bernardetiaceae bacterium]|nr:hypothetical protein [Bernardetiaceae bacterium]